MIEISDNQTVTVDLERNPKQWQYFLEVLKACNGKSKKRKFAYGGAIRGGKTFVTLFILVYLCNRYPGSKWAVIRDTMPTLRKTTIESLKKLLNNSPDWEWNLDPGNFFVQNKLGSRIYFIPENIAADPDLKKFLGLEINGVFFEQLEELQKKTWEIVISRVGSWYVQNMPPAFVFTTFNPTQTWVKADIYERAMKNELPADFHFQTAFHFDNAFVTEDQRETWATMDDRWQRQLIKGEWTDFDDKDPRWLYSFDESKHIATKPLELIKNMPVHLSFDFNVDPMTCIVGQHTTGFGTGTFARIIDELILPNTTAAEMCKQLKVKYPYNVITVTGDASGNNRNAGYTSGEDTIWKQVKTKLKLAPGQFLTPKSNPSHTNSRFICNTVVHSHPSFLISPTCIQLIHECKTAKPIKTQNADFEDKLLKGPGASEIGFNIFDCFRYYNHTHFINFVKFP